MRLLFSSYLSSMLDEIRVDGSHVEMGRKDSPDGNPVNARALHRILCLHYGQATSHASAAAGMLKLRKLSRLIRLPRSKYKDKHYLCERQGRILLS